MSGLVLLPCLLLPRRRVFALSRTWARGVLWLLRMTVGITHQVRGVVVPEKGQRYIYALKHQSAWETIAFLVIGPPFAGVLKRELIYLPIYGWFLVRAGMVPIRRSSRGSALKSMLKAARSLVAEGRHLMIMPEGTRVPPGTTGTYHPGVYALYKYLEIPVLPVAHNAGLFWARNSFIKRPGVVTMSFLEPIPAGLGKPEFMALLESRIEDEARILLENPGQHAG